jgi:hypothetical protein
VFQEDDDEEEERARASRTRRCIYVTVDDID